ncbi:MAG TPA: hypothetical protein VFF63_08105 [Candidatus Babeliales bacterium]|nr:hypothetical protein [Candidatus Babeliales bacterium]
MTASPDFVPLPSHRAFLHKYLRAVVFATDSVAGRIIEERLPGWEARDQLRPCLVLWACAAGGGDLSDAGPVAAAFELFDRFLVLHDELANDPSDTVARWGLGQSLNAGDALYALAFRSLAIEVGDPVRRIEAARLAGEAVLRAIETTGEVARNAVLTAAAMEAGAVMAGAAPTTARAFGEAGARLLTDPHGAAASLRPYASREDIGAFEDVARYIARRAA